MESVVKRADQSQQVAATEALSMILEAAESIQLPVGRLGTREQLSLVS
jgi:hypothetical protein